MSDYSSVRDNIIIKGKRPNRDDLFGRIFVVSAYGGITNQLLEHKKTGEPGVYSLFADSYEDKQWMKALSGLKEYMLDINRKLFGEGELYQQSADYISQRIDSTEKCLSNLHNLCMHGHFALEDHLHNVREMLASLGEAHSAYNTAALLSRDGIPAKMIDLTGWNSDQHILLDERINNTLAEMNTDQQIPIVTGYAHCKTGLMRSFDRGYSEMTFSRMAVLSKATEAIIHKEFHLSSADPNIVGEENAVPIGRTNYDVADQLANLGMEAIHPKAAKGLRQNNIALRVKNTFEPEHFGTLVTGDYISEKPCVEIIAGCTGVYALEVFDQDMAGKFERYDSEILAAIKRFKARVISKGVNANTITHFLSTNLKTIKRIRTLLEETFPDAELNNEKVAIVSAIGSDMKVPGILAKTVKAVADTNVSVLAAQQSMRQVDMQFVIKEADFKPTIRALHSALVEVHDHGIAICLAD